MEQARSDGRPIGIALIDIDGFRLLNETYGHDAGDRALLTVAEVIATDLPATMTCGRYGPDEFLIIVPADQVAELAPVVDRLRVRLADQALQFDASERLPISVSVGMCTYPEHADSVTALLTVAAVTLLEARASGGDSVRFAARETEDPADRQTFDVFQGLILAVDTKDRYTKRHSEDVARYAVYLGRQLDLDPATLEILRVAGLLHDIGKIGIPDHILRKPGKLTDEEFHVVKQHVALGDVIVRDLPDVETIRAGRPPSSRAVGRGRLSPRPGRRDHPADRPDPRRRRRVLGDDHDPAVPQGARRDGGAAPPRGRRRDPARGAPRRGVRRRHRDRRGAPLPGGEGGLGLWTPSSRVA